MSEIQHKDLSNNATGIVLKETKISTDKRRGVVESINIYPEQNMFNVSYRVERLDSNDVPFTDVTYKTKTVRFKDEARWGTVDYDEFAVPKWETFVETKAENLNVSNWYAQLGTAILTSAITYIETVEGL